MSECIFCKIVNRKLPSFTVFEDDGFLAFLSIAPINPGHTLIIPKKHSEYLLEMDDKLLGKILIFSKPVAAALVKALKPRTGKVGIMVAGLEVPHSHLHLIPMNSEGDLTFSRARGANNDELKTVLEKIHEAW